MSSILEPSMEAGNLNLAHEDEDANDADDAAAADAAAAAAVAFVTDNSWSLRLTSACNSMFICCKERASSSRRSLSSRSRSVSSTAQSARPSADSAASRASSSSSWALLRSWMACSTMLVPSSSACWRSSTARLSLEISSWAAATSLRQSCGSSASSSRSRFSAPSSGPNGGGTAGAAPRLRNSACMRVAARVRRARALVRSCKATTFMASFAASTSSTWFFSRPCRMRTRHSLWCSRDVVHAVCFLAAPTTLMSVQKCIGVKGSSAMTSQSSDSVSGTHPSSVLAGPRKGALPSKA
mmetsp:Transcript_135011/g.431367  ORF Transcript_135011/g.431367 Transcript_135011/m.431367 type:complete len:297 (-) Transcript_135011:436-1326(-)